MFSKLSLSTKQEIAKHAHELPNQEVCGLILKDGSVVRSPNKLPDKSDVPDSAPNKQDNFAIDPDVWIRNAAMVDGIYHSHCSESHPAYLSSEDIRNSRDRKIAYALYHTQFDQWDLFDPRGLHPYPLKADRRYTPKDIEYYLRWPFEWGRSDCLTVFRSYYQGMLGIEIDDFDREDDRKFLKQGWNRYIDNFPSQGFRQVTGEPLKNDVILMKIHGRNPHHVGVLVDDHFMSFLHLLEPGTLSRRDIYGGEWMDKKHSVWRHEKL